MDEHNKPDIHTSFAGDLKHYPFITKFSAKNNDISEIFDRIFSKNKRLRNADFSSNKIEKLDSIAFYGNTISLMCAGTSGFQENKSECCEATPLYRKLSLISDITFAVCSSRPHSRLHRHSIGTHIWPTVYQVGTTVTLSFTRVAEIMRSTCCVVSLRRSITAEKNQSFTHSAK